MEQSAAPLEDALKELQMHSGALEARLLKLGAHVLSRSLALCLSLSASLSLVAVLSLPLSLSRSLSATLSLFLNLSLSAPPHL